MRKRVLSLLLAICLVIGLLPPTTLATSDGASGSGSSMGGASGSGGSTENAGHEPITITIAGNALWTDKTEGVYYASVTQANSGSTAVTVTVTEITAEIANGTKGDADWNIMLDYSNPVPVLTLRNVNIGTSSRHVAQSGIKAVGTGALNISVEGINVLNSHAVNTHTIHLNMGGVTTISSVGEAKLSLYTKTQNNRTLYSAGAGGVVLENVNLETQNKTSTSDAGGSIHVKQGDLEIKGGTVTANSVGALITFGIYVDAGKLKISNNAQVTINKTSATASSNQNVDATVYAVKTSGGIEIAGGSLEIFHAAGGVDHPSNGKTVKHRTISGPVSYNLAAEGDAVVALYNINEASRDTASTEHTQENMEGYKYISFRYVCGEGNHKYSDEDPYNPTCIKCGDSTRPVPKDITVSVGSITWNAIAGDVFYAKVASNAVEDITAKIASGELTDADWNIKLDNRDLVAKLTLKGVNLDIATTGIKASGAGALDISVEGASTVVTQGADCLSLNMGEGTTISSVGGAKLTLNTKTTGQYYALNSAGAGGVTLKNANLVANSGTNAGYAGGSIKVELGDLKVEGGTLTVKTDFNVNVTNALGVLVNAGKLIVSDGAKVTVNKTSKGASSNLKSDLNSYAVEAAGGIEIAGGSLTVTNAAGSTDVAGGSYSVHHGTISGTVSYTPAAGDKVVAAYTEAATTVNDTTATSEAIPADNILEAYKYISFQYVCGADNHNYGNDPSNPTCLKCGYIDPTNPKDITVTFGNYVDGVIDQQIVWNVNPGEVYYAKTNDQGVISNLCDLGKWDPNTDEPEGWNIKLDNRKNPAMLTLSNAYIKKVTDKGSSQNNNAIKVVGEGALEIVIEGKTTIETGYKSPIVTSMNGGTTYTSVNGGKLTLLQNGTSGVAAIEESAGVLNFKNANIYASSKCSLKNIANAIVNGSFDVNVIGGNIEIESVNCSTNGLAAGGKLSLSDFAKVRLIGQKQADNRYVATTPRYAVQATGDIIIDNASLRIIDAIGNWDVAVNKMPSLNENVKAFQGNNADGSDRQVFTTADGSIEAPYVAFIYDCENIDDKLHEYTDDTDPECNDCGFIRDVPRDVTLRVVTNGGDKNKPLDENSKAITIKAKEVYYVVADDKGLVTSITKTEPEKWDFMLDNSNPVAELVFNDGAYLNKAGELTETVNDKVTYLNLLSISGAGKLNVTIKGAATLTSGYSNVIQTAMKGGTTYTSVNGGKLTLNQNGTGGQAALTETAGVLNFKNANIYASSMRNNKNNASSIVTGSFDVNVIGGNIEIESVNCSTNGLAAGGKLSLSDFAKVRLIGQKQAANRYVATTPRYAVQATGDIIIDNASLRIIDAIGNWDVAINKMPSLNENVKAFQGNNADGSDRQVFTTADGSIEAPYVAFIYDCENIDDKLHEYTDDTDPECNDCGFIRDVPRDVTLRVVTNGGDKNKPLDENSKAITIKAKEVYYVVADEKGFVTSITKTEPEKWDFMLDNSNPVAELVFNDGAYLNKAGELTETVNDKVTYLNLLSISGAGKLNVTIKGAATLTSGYSNVIQTAMKGGTTYTSVNGGKLTLNQNGTGGQAALTETAGVLNFKNANIYASSMRNNKNNASSIVTGSFDVNVIGGYIEIESVNCSTNGLAAGGNLKLTKWANVRLIGQKQAANRYVATTPRYAVRATGDIIIDNASLRIIDAIGNWDVAVNKSPKLFGGSAKYSESAEGTNLQPLNPADPAAPVEYPYVEYVVDCAEHIWDGPADPTCNRCGFIRAIPYNIQVAFQFGTSALGIVAWDAKVGEVYYAKTNDAGVVIDLGKQDSEPKDWNIKLDNSVGNEAILTFKGATIIRKVAPTSKDKIFGMTASAFGGTVGARGKGSLRIVCEKASTITTDASASFIVTSMNGGTTYESKDNAKLTFTTSKSSPYVGIQESVGNLTFDHANVYIKMMRTAKVNANTTVSAPRNMTVIGGKVEIVASAYASNGLNVKGNLLVKENGILIVTTGSSPKGGTCENRPYGINVAGDITVDNATLMIKSYSAYWKYLVNKMPTLVGADSYMSEKSTKESKLEAFSKDAGADLTELVAKFLYFSNAEPGTLEDSTAEEEDDFDDSFIFDDTDNPFTGDTVNVTLLFVLIVTSAAALVVLFSKKKALRE